MKLFSIQLCIFLSTGFIAAAEGRLGQINYHKLYSPKQALDTDIQESTGHSGDFKRDETLRKDAGRRFDNVADWRDKEYSKRPGRFHYDDFGFELENVGGRGPHRGMHSERGHFENERKAGRLALSANFI